MRDPRIGEHLVLGEPTSERLLHPAHRLDKGTEAVHVLDRLRERVDASPRRRLEIDRQEVPTDAAVEIDREHLFDHLALSEIDLPFGDRDEQRLEDAPRGRVLARDRGRHPVTKVLVDRRGVGVRHAACLDGTASFRLEPLERRGDEPAELLLRGWSEHDVTRRPNSEDLGAEQGDLGIDGLTARALA